MRWHPHLLLHAPRSCRTSQHVSRRADEPEALFGSDDDGDDDGAMDDDFGGALGDLSGSDPDSDVAPAQPHALLNDGDGEDAAGDEFGGSEDDDDDEADGLAGGIEGDTSDDDDADEGPEAGGSGSSEELETRAERQSRRLDKLKCAASACLPVVTRRDRIVARCSEKAALRRPLRPAASVTAWVHCPCRDLSPV